MPFPRRPQFQVQIVHDGVHEGAYRVEDFVLNNRKRLSAGDTEKVRGLKPEGKVTLDARVIGRTGKVDVIRTTYEKWMKKHKPKPREPGPRVKTEPWQGPRVKPGDRVQILQGGMEGKTGIVVRIDPGDPGGVPYLVVDIGRYRSEKASKWRKVGSDMDPLRKRVIKVAYENPGEVREALLPLLKEAKYGKGRIVKFKRALGELLVDVEGYGLVKVTLDSSGLTTTHGRHPSAVTWAALQAVKAYRKAGFPMIRPHEKWPKEAQGPDVSSGTEPDFSLITSARALLTNIETSWDALTFDVPAGPGQEAMEAPAWFVLPASFTRVSRELSRASRPVRPAVEALRRQIENRLPPISAGTLYAMLQRLGHLLEEIEEDPTTSALVPAAGQAEQAANKLALKLRRLARDPDERAVAVQTRQVLDRVSKTAAIKRTRTNTE